MGTGLVVVTNVIAKERLELTARRHEEMVQAVLADGPYPTLGEGVRARRPCRRAHHFNDGRGDDSVETCGELGVPVA